MKILISNIRLNTPHGSEVWCLTIAKELLRRGHKVNFYSLEYGGISKTLMEAGCGLLCRAVVSRKHYDIGILNHAHVMKDDLERTASFDRVALITHSIIQKVHGKTQPERPPVSWQHCDKYQHFAISKEVAEFWSDRVECKVLPNPVASDFFNIPELSPDTPEVILWGNHRWRVPQVLKHIAHEKGYKIIGGFNNISPDSVLKIMSKCRIVAGTGRWIYEGMAAGRNCIVMNDTKINGHVSGDLYQYMQNYNMTCRLPSSKALNKTRMETAVMNYNPARGQVMRKLAFDNHHVEKIVDKLLEV